MRVRAGSAQLIDVMTLILEASVAGVQSHRATRLVRVTHCFLRRALACLACAGTVAHAGSLDLMQAYEAAVRHDAQFRAAQAARDAGAEEVNIGRSLLLPSVLASYSDGRTRAYSNTGESLSGSGTFSSSGSSDSSLNSRTTSTSVNQLGRTTARDSLLDRQSVETSSSSGVLGSRNLETIIDRSRGTSAGASLEIRQPIIDLSAWAGYRQGQALSSASEAEFRSQQQELMLRVAEAYAAVLFEEESLRLARSQLETLTLQQATNERLLAAGQGTITDVLETRAKRELAQAQLIEAEDILAVARSRLSFITGLSVQTLAPLKTELADAEQMLQPLDFWRGSAQENNGRLLSLAHQVDVAREEARKAEGGHYPRLELVASIGEQRFRNRPTIDTRTDSSTSRETNVESSSTTQDRSTVTEPNFFGVTTTSTADTNTTTSTTGSSRDTEAGSRGVIETGSRRASSRDRYVGLQLTIPIFQGGGISARVRQAAARLSQAQAEFDGLRDQIMLDLNQQYRLVQSASQRSRALGQAVQSSKVAVEATLKSMTAGVRTNLDALNARERQTAAERELASARYNYLLALLRLRFNAGILSEQDLRTVAASERTP
jgi:outer membrane protein, protease secretion system